jgi:hypothetical protein
MKKRRNGERNLRDAAKLEENAAAFAAVKEMYRGHPNLIRKMRRRILEGRSMRVRKCDQCGERGTVEVCELRDGEVVSRRYCVGCAVKAGVGGV